jgi:hypothetical protein
MRAAFLLAGIALASAAPVGSSTTANYQDIKILPLTRKKLLWWPSLGSCIFPPTEMLCGTRDYCNSFDDPNIESRIYESAQQCFDAHEPGPSVSKKRPWVEAFDFCLHTPSEIYCGTRRYCQRFDFAERMFQPQYSSRQACLDDHEEEPNQRSVDVSPPLNIAQDSQLKTR